MRKYLAALVFCAGSVLPVKADLKTDLGLALNNVLLFGGDSITDARMYSHYLCAWFQLTYPELDLATYPVGRSGSSLPGWATTDTTPPAESNYERMCYPFSPTHVFMMHGQNGGQTTTEHYNSYSDLWTTWVNGTDSAKLICLGMHPVQAATDTKSAEGKADQEAVLAGTSASIFASHTFDQMGAAWLANSSNTTDVQQSGVEPSSGTRDTVHPGPAGHVVIAWAVLQGLGAETLVSEATINASTGAVTADNNCTISSVSAATTLVQFDRLDAKLPWAIDENGRANAVALYPAIANWQTYGLTVSNLAAGTYDIRIDGEKVAEATQTELAAGVNLADMTSGPIFDQVQEVLGEVRDLYGCNRTTVEKLAGNANTGTLGDVYDYSTVYYQNGEERGATYKSSMATAVGNLSTALGELHADAQPVTRAWVVQLQGAPGKSLRAGSVTIGP